MSAATDDDFRRTRYQTDPMIRQITDMLESALHHCDVTPHDLARCAVLAAFHHAMHHNAAITVVLRDGVPGEFIATEADLERLARKANEVSGG